MELNQKEITAKNASQKKNKNWLNLLLQKSHIWTN